MRGFASIILGAALASSACVDTSQHASGLATDSPVITLLHVNDTHSHLAAWGPKDANLDGTLGGIARAGAIVAYEKSVDPDALFVHAGDLVHGDLFFDEYLGVPELLLLQQLGLDVMVIGNHEFQYGPAFLTGVLAGAWPTGGGVPMLGTNLDLSGYPGLGKWITPTFLKEANGVQVGFFGLTTPYDPLAQAQPVVIEDDLAPIAAQAVAELRAQGAQVVVCVAHLGMPLSRQIAAAVPGIDVIVNGHDHVALAQPETVGHTLIVSAGEYYRWVGKLRVRVLADRVQLVDYALESVDDTVAPLPEVEATVEQLQAGIALRYGDVYHQVLGWADQPIPDDWNARHAKRDTAIGDLFTDAYREATGTQIAFEASGFLDEGLPAGPIVPADVYRSMGYGLPVVDGGELRIAPFRLATFTLSGAELIHAFEVALAGPGDIFPQVSGLRLEYDSRKPAGQRVLLGSVHVGGPRLSPGATYTATANEGMLLFFPRLGIQVHDVHILDETAWQAAQDLIAERGVIDAGTSGRIRDVAAVARKP